MTTNGTPNDTPTSDVDTDKVLEIEALALEDVKLADEQTAIAERREQIKARLLALHPGHGTIPAGPYKVTVRHGARRLDPTKVAEAYPVTRHPELYKPTIDTGAVKHHLSPAELEQYQTVGKPTVVIA